VPVGRGGIGDGYTVAPPGAVPLGVLPLGILPLGIVVAGIAMCLIGRTTTGPAAAWLAGALVAAQIAAVVWLLTRRLAVVYRAALVGTALAASASAALVLGLTTRSAGLAVAGICHATAYSTLLIWFARSLRPDHEPVVTQFARRMRRTMPAEVVRYTRLVTIAWCVFFAAQLSLSGALLALAPAAVWSAFVNLLNLPLTLAMILAEFGCRSLLFHHDNRTGLLATFEGLRRISGSRT
jgi:uncharacterized membrane protein